MIYLSLVMLGALTSFEAIVALFWKYNDKTFKAQAVRVARVVGGIYLVVVGMLKQIPVLLIDTAPINLNGLIQTALNASVMGIAMFLSVRYVGRLVDKIEKPNKNGKDDQTKN